MNNNYICKFINSKDIRSYLSDTDYEFSTPEYAYLIWQSTEHTIRQRHEEFEKLIASTETHVIKTSCCREGWDLHQTIKDYVALENRLIDQFTTIEANCFYTGEWIDQGEWIGETCYFNEYDKAYAYVKKNASKCSPYSFRIKKIYIDNSHCQNGAIFATYNSLGQMVCIDLMGDIFNSLNSYDSELLTERFSDMWFDIPIPFKPSDIVCDCYQNIPFVLTDTVPWYRKEHPPKRNNSTIHLTNMDMTASGYSVNENMSIKYNWLSFQYMNLEYYRQPLDNEKRVLSAYSLFKQNKINGDTLVKLIQIYTAEHLAKQFYNDLDWIIDDETRNLLDINKYEEANRHDK